MLTLRRACSVGDAITYAPPSRRQRRAPPQTLAPAVHSSSIVGTPHRRTMQTCHKRGREGKGSQTTHVATRWGHLTPGGRKWRGGAGQGGAGGPPGAVPLLGAGGGGGGGGG